MLHGWAHERGQSLDAAIVNVWGCRAVPIQTASQWLMVSESLDLIEAGGREGSPNNSHDVGSACPLCRNVPKADSKNEESSSWRHLSHVRDGLRRAGQRANESTRDGFGIAGETMELTQKEPNLLCHPQGISRICCRDGNSVEQ